MALDTSVNDMDIDMTFEEDEDPEITRLRAQAAELEARAEAVRVEAMNGVEEVPEEGEIDANAPAPNKVHIRGLDRLNTYDIEQYASEHYPSDLFQKVQWIDDTSANLIYDTPTAAAEALVALSVEEVSEPLQLRAAKALSTHPDVELQVRQAIAADVKMRGAKDQSRFYLMNPRWDPDNPDNERPGVKRRRPDDEYSHNKYRRRDYEYDRRRRGSEKRQPEFHEDMYGDDPQAATDSRRNSSYSSNSEYGRPRRNDSQDLFAGKQDGRLRNRSASPSRDEDGRYGFEDSQPYRQTARARSRTPPRVRGGRDNRDTRDKLRKELFPNRASSTPLSNGHANSHSRQSSTNSNKELFPDKFNSVHRRQDAKDINPEEITQAIGQCSINNGVHFEESFTYSSSGRRPEPNERPKNSGGDLFSRISGGPQAESSYGRLSSGGGGGIEFNIKGAGEAGFSILGASKERVQSPLVKELFPLKGGNAAKPDLFDGRIKGRAGRRRAEEYF